MNNLNSLDALYIASALVGLIAGIPKIVRLVKRYCPLVTSIARGVLSVLKEMILLIGGHPAFVALTRLMPYIARYGCFVIGMLCKFAMGMAGVSLNICVLCFIAFLIIGEIEFYLFSKLAV